MAAVEIPGKLKNTEWASNVRGALASARQQASRARQALRQQEIPNALMGAAAAGVGGVADGAISAMWPSIMGLPTSPVVGAIAIIGGAYTETTEAIHLGAGMIACELSRRTEVAARSYAASVAGAPAV